MLQARGLTKRYGDLLAVDDVSFTVEPGEIMGFLGPNGAGKTTTILMLLGILKPDQGSATVCGEKVGPAHKETRRLIGAVSEHSFLYPEMTVVDYLSFFAGIYRVGQPEKRIDEVLEELKLVKRRNHLAGSLSKGLQQKLSLARALLHEPPVLILDEPVSGLDPHGMREVREIIIQQRNRGKSILLSSHALSEIERSADRVGIIRDGRLLVEATPAELQAQTAGVLKLEVELDRPGEPFEGAVRKIPGVVAVEHDQGRMSITIDGSNRAQARQSVSRTLTGAGATILGLREVKGSLEDAFVTLTQAGTSPEGQAP